MKYFATIDELFDFTYLMTEAVLQDLPKEMLDNIEEVKVSSTLTSELDPAMENHLRVDRNIKVYLDIMKRLKYNDLDDINHIIDLNVFIDKTISQKPEIDSLITNTQIASILTEHREFIPLNYPSDIIGSPYVIGKIGNIKIIVDPYMKWDNTDMILFSKKDIRVAAYIKSADVSYQGLSAAKLESIICSYIMSSAPIYRVNVSMQIEEQDEKEKS